MSLPMIIDVHIHPKPDAGRQSLQVILEEFRRNGVALGLLSSVGVEPWHQYPPSKEVRAANEGARELIASSGGRLRWLMYLNPQNADRLKEMSRCAAAGAIGVKLWISLKDKHGGFVNTEQALAHAGRLHLPVLIHTFNRTADPNLPGEITLAEFTWLAKRHPRTRMIAAHAGNNWPAETGLYRSLPNMWVDIGGGYPIKGQVEALVRAMGADRVLFASDWPCRSQASQLAKVMLADISKKQKKQILCENALSVFGLNNRLPSNEAPPEPAACPVDETEDHFCFCGRWPFFKTEASTPKILEGVLAREGIQRAYSADLGSIYRQDMLSANESFLAATRGLSRVKPLAVINPRVPDYQSVLETLSQRFAGIILFPCLHGWNLADPRHDGLFRRCRQRGLKLWINCQLGDPRFRHAGTIFRPVAEDELLRLAASPDTPPVVFQGVFEGVLTAFLSRHGKDKRFRYELSRLTDSPGALARVLKKYGAARLVMGSEYPFRDIRQVRWASRRMNAAPM